MSRKPFKVIAGLAAAALLMAACSSSSSSGDSTGTTNRATGSPILVGQVLPITGANIALPQEATSMAASVAAVNDAGGINGHPLKLIQCDSMGDPTTEVQCAQSMVKDHVVATLGDDTFAAETQVQDIFNAAGIPRIGLEKGAVAEYESPTDFDFTGGGIFILVAMMDNLINRGDKKITVVLPESPTAAQTPLLLDPIAKNQGASVVNLVLVSNASGDYSQYVAQAEQNGAQGVVLALPTAQLVQFAETVNQLNPKIDFTTGIEGFTLDQLKQLGAFARKASYVSWVPGIDDVKDFPGLAQPLAALTKYTRGANVDTIIPQELQSWLAVHAFYEVMKTQTGTPTAASVVAAFRAAKDIPMAGIIKPWTPADYQPAGNLSSIVKNVTSPWAYTVTYNGKATHTSTSELFNTFAGLPGTATAGSTS